MQATTSISLITSFLESILLCLGVDQCIQKFLDVARQTECFFLQKRLQLSVQKPEQVIKEVCLNYFTCVVLEEISCVPVQLIASFTLILGFSTECCILSCQNLTINIALAMNLEKLDACSSVEYQNTDGSFIGRNKPVSQILLEVTISEISDLGEQNQCIHSAFPLFPLLESL